MIKLGVETIECQKTGFLVSARQVQQNYSIVTKLVVDSYWKEFVETYLGTEYMPQAVALLTNEAVTMLQWLYDHNEVTEGRFWPFQDIEAHISHGVFTPNFEQEFGMIRHTLESLL